MSTFYYQLSVKPERLNDAQQEMNAEKIGEDADTIVQPFVPEPKGFKFWFEAPEARKFRKQSIYNI